MTTKDGTGSKKPPCTTVRCTFAGGEDERGGFTGEQLRYPCKLRRRICAKCGVHRSEHDRPYAGVSDDLLPPRKRSTFRRLGEFHMLQGLGSGSEEEKKEVATQPLKEEGPSCWSGGSAITKGKRGPRRKRADLLCCESCDRVSFQV